MSEKAGQTPVKNGSLPREYSESSSGLLVAADLLASLRFSVARSRVGASGQKLKTLNGVRYETGEGVTVLRTAKTRRNGILPRASVRAVSEGLDIARMGNMGAPFSGVSIAIVSSHLRAVEGVGRQVVPDFVQAAFFRTDDAETPVARFSFDMRASGIEQARVQLPTAEHMRKLHTLVGDGQSTAGDMESQAPGLLADVRETLHHVIQITRDEELVPLDGAGDLHLGLPEPRLGQPGVFGRFMDRILDQPAIREF